MTAEMKERNIEELQEEEEEEMEKDGRRMMASLGLLEE